MFEQCVLGILQPLAWGSCLSDWTHIFIFGTLPSLCLLLLWLCPSSANSWYLLCNHFGTGNFITVFLKIFFHVSVRHSWNVLVAYYIHSENTYENSSHTSSLFYSVNKPTLQLSTPDCPLWYTVYLFSGVVTPLFCLVFSLHSLFFKLPLPHEALHAIWWTQSISEILAGQASEKQTPLASRCTAQFFPQWNVLDSHYKRWIELNCQWAYLLSDTGAWLFIISPLVPEIENVPISRDCTPFYFIFPCDHFFVFFPVTVIVVSQSCVKWRLMLNFVLQQSIKDWSLMVQREWRDQWRNDLRTFSTVSMVSFVQPNADYVLKVQFIIH